MNAERLLAHYERIADAPDAIPRLRRFILDLAVRGKLVPQDPNDEPASELLKRIEKEKARLVAEGGFNSLEPVDDECATIEPFAIPSTWAWCLLDDIAGIARGGSPRPIKSFLTEDANGIPWIKIGDSTRGSIYINSTEERIKPEGLSRSRLVVPGDLLLSNSMSFGYPYITNISGCIHDGWLVIRTPENQISKLYIHSMFLSEYAKQAFSRAAAGAVVQNLNADKVRRLLIPLPPLAEQYRIVAKVDELMGLCDRLEAARASREGLRDRLAAASLARLNAPDTKASPAKACPREGGDGTGFASGSATNSKFQAHARFTLDALPALTTRPDQIKALRQTILNLAVRGKLVPQDANDEPAKELLKRAIEAKFALRKERRIGRDEDPEYSASLGEVSCPQHWAWGYLADFALVLGGKRLPAGARFSAEPTNHIYIRVTDMKSGAISPDSLKYLSTDVQRQIAKYTIDKEDIYITIAGTIGEVGEVPSFFHGHNITENAAKIVFREIDKKFLIMVLRSEDVQTQFSEKTKQMAQPKLALKRILGARVPLPPLAEQHRIVAKVDALMALCDRLEASLAATAATRRRLLDALLAGALVPIIQRDAA